MRLDTRHLMLGLVLLVLPVSLACLGGRFADEQEVCDAYLDCLAVEHPTQVAAANALYGSSSTCWDSRAEAERCAAGCRAAAQAIDRCELPISRDDADFRPALGTWVTVGGQVMADTCDVGPDALTGIQLTLSRGSGPGRYELRIGDSDVALDCDLRGRELSCEVEFIPDDVPFELVIMEAMDLTFRDEASFDGVWWIEIECSPDCESLNCRSTLRIEGVHR